MSRISDGERMARIVMHSKSINYRNKIQELTAERDRYKLALEFYADPDNWKTDMELNYECQREFTGLNKPFQMSSGGWFVAREALAPVKDEVKCDCHLHERQVCDICQGIGGKDEGKL